MKKIIIVTASALLLSVQAWAISESNYAAEYREKVLPLLNSYQHGNFKGEKSISIHYATYTTNPKSTRCMVVLPGRTESIEKYAEVIHSLDNGALKGEFQYFLMDHRGQGSSGRMIKGEGTESERGYVDDFNNYSLDLKNFLDTVVSKFKCTEKLLLAHSLGAGISLDFMLKHPEYFDKAALSSPMLKIQTKPYKYVVARAIVTASVLAGRKKMFAIGQEAYDSARDFEANTFTSSPSRYEMAKDMFDLFPQTRLGGVTNGWLNEVMISTRQIRKQYHELSIPLRVFHAGIESYAETNEMIRLCNEAPYCNRIFLETSKHEVLMDRDVNRDVVIAELERFFK